MPNDRKKQSRHQTHLRHMSHLIKRTYQFSNQSIKIFVKFLTTEKNALDTLSSMQHTIYKEYVEILMSPANYGPRAY